MTSHRQHTDLALSRRARQMFEPYHTMIFFAPEARQAFLEVGLKGFWRSYFASRASPLGPASAAVVTATFYVFHPTMVARALPETWRIASPEQVLQVRLEIEDRTDLLALPPWQHLGRERSERLLSLAQPINQRVVDQGGIPPVNPMGL